MLQSLTFFEQHSKLMGICTYDADNGRMRRNTEIEKTLERALAKATAFLAVPSYSLPPPQAVSNPHPRGWGQVLHVCWNYWINWKWPKNPPWYTDHQANPKTCLHSHSRYYLCNDPSNNPKCAGAHVCAEDAEERAAKNFDDDARDALPANFLSLKERAPGTPQTLVWTRKYCFIFGMSPKSQMPTISSSSQRCMEHGTFVCTTTMYSESSLASMACSFTTTWLGSWEPGQLFAALANFGPGPRKKTPSWLWVSTRMVSVFHADLYLNKTLWQAPHAHGIFCLSLGLRHPVVVVRWTGTE